MAELDVFEARFAAAYRRYLDEAPTEVDAAAVARTVGAAHRSVRWRPWGWALRPVALSPTVLWLTLLMLLVAALGAALLAGVPPPRRTSACPPGAQPDVPGPIDQARPPSVVFGAAFDRAIGRIVVLAASDSPMGRPTPASTWTFDVCSNTWAIAGHGLPGNDLITIVYDADSNTTVAVGREGRVWAYDTAGGAWLAKGPVPWPPPVGQTNEAASNAVQLVYDDRTGNVLATRFLISPVELWSYDVEADRWQLVARDPIPNPGTGGGDDGFVGAWLVALDGSTGHLVASRQVQRPPTFENAGETWVFDPATGTRLEVASAPPMNLGYGPSGGELAYADSVRRTIAFSDGLVVAYDASANRWEVLAGTPFAASTSIGSSLPTGPLARLGHHMVYDPLNERLIVLGGQYRAPEGSGVGWVDALASVWAFSPASRTWLELLPRSSP